jgi:LemA protein
MLDISTQNLLLIALAALLVFWAVGAHNRLVRLSNAVVSAYPPLDAQLRERARLFEQWLDLAERLPAEQRAPLAQALQAQRSALDALRQRPSSVRALNRLIDVSAQCEHERAALSQQIESSVAADPLWHQWRVALQQLDEQATAQSQAYRSATEQFNEAAAEFPALLVARLVGLKPLPELAWPKTERPTASSTQDRRR